MTPLTAGSLGGLRHVHSGKVRELFAVEPDRLLVVATDRVSAYDHVLPTEVPDKGAVLTGLSLWWFTQLADVVPNHVVTGRVADYPAELAPYVDALRGRSMLCRRLRMLPVECVARGYLAGSALADYRRTGTVGGTPLPAGLAEGARLPEPVFTPTTKAVVGQHDEPLPPTEVAALVGDRLAEELRIRTLAVYRRAATVAERRGFLLADTKLEFGLDDTGSLTLGDEVLTPDSSRYWPAESWRPGSAQPAYDKQIVRDWLAGTGWDRVSAPPSLPGEVVAATRDRYVEAYERLTGQSFRVYLAAA